MEIIPPNAIGRLSSIKGSVQKKKSKVGSFTLEEGSAEENTSSKIQDMSSINPSLFVSLQEISAHQKEVYRQIERADDLLNGLNRLRIQILEGNIEQETLTFLEKKIKDVQQYQLPDSLQELIQDIEVRVAVELAKQGS